MRDVTESRTSFGNCEGANNGSAAAAVEEGAATAPVCSMATARWHTAVTSATDIFPIAHSMAAMTRAATIAVELRTRGSAAKIVAAEGTCSITRQIVCNTDT